MTFISYAPNCEDVPLWRALRSVPLGRYADWGAEPADGASVTRAFYDRGWSGLSVRPTPEAAQALAAARPRDIVRTGAVALPLPAAGPLHFLRVSGSAWPSLPLAELRPWIVIAPAGDPAAEAALAAAGYRVTLWDGISHFHLSPEHPDLAPLLAAPANASDDFRRAADGDAAPRLAAAEAALREAQARADGSRRQALDATRTAGRARSDVALMAEQAAWLHGLLAETKQQAAESRSEAAWLRGQHEDARAAAAEQLKQLAARADEAAWLRSCLADSEARAVALDRRLLALDRHRQDAEDASRAARQRMAQLETSISWRVTTPLRRARGLFIPPPHPAPAPAPVRPARSTANVSLTTVVLSLQPPARMAVASCSSSSGRSALATRRRIERRS